MKSKSGIPVPDVSRKTKLKQREASVPRPVTIIGTADVEESLRKADVIDRIPISGSDGQRKTGEPQTHSKFAQLFGFGFGKKNKEARAKFDSTVKRYSYDAESVKPEKEAIDRQEFDRQAAVRNSERPGAISSKLLRKNDTTTSRIARFLKPSQSHNAQLALNGTSPSNGVGELPQVVKSSEKPVSPAAVKPTQLVSTTTSTNSAAPSKAHGNKILNAALEGNSNLTTADSNSVAKGLTSNECNTTTSQAVAPSVNVIPDAVVPASSIIRDEVPRHDVATQCEVGSINNAVAELLAGKTITTTVRKCSSLSSVALSNKQRAAPTDNKKINISTMQRAPACACNCHAADSKRTLKPIDSDSGHQTQSIDTTCDGTVDSGDSQKHQELENTIREASRADEASQIPIQADGVDWVQVRRDEFEAILTQMAELKQYAQSLQAVLIQCSSQQ